MSARRFFDAGFCFCVLDGPSFYGHFTCLDDLMKGDVPALYRDLRPVIRLSASNGLS